MVMLLSLIVFIATKTVVVNSVIMSYYKIYLLEDTVARATLIAIEYGNIESEKQPTMMSST